MPTDPAEASARSPDPRSTHLPRLRILVLVSLVVASEATAAALVSRSGPFQGAAVSQVWSTSSDFRDGTLSALDANRSEGGLVLSPAPGTFGAPPGPPLLGPGAPSGSSPWDNGSIPSVAVLANGSGYQMWYTGCSTTIAFCGIGYATSQDGLNWTRYPGNPVLSHNSSMGLFAPGDPTVIHLGSGYRMWFVGNVPASSGVSENQAIWTARSPDGIRWQIWPAPVLTPTNGTWDTWGLGEPRVIRAGNGFVLFFAGLNYNVERAIGRATSTDGINWTQDPGNPVLTPSPGSWENDEVWPAQILLVPGGYEMYYLGRNPQYGDSDTPSLGRATSPDGRAWTRDPQNPLYPLPYGGNPNAPPPWDAAVVVGPAGNRMWFTFTATVSGRMAVGYAVSPGYTRAGEFLTQIVDAGSPEAVWESVRWNVTLGPWGSIEVWMRAGTTPTPDPSWRGLSVNGGWWFLLPYTGARYVQIIVDLVTDQYGTTPQLHSLTLVYTNPPYGATATGEPVLLLLLVFGGAVAAVSVRSILPRRPLG